MLAATAHQIRIVFHREKCSIPSPTLNNRRDVAATARRYLKILRGVRLDWLALDADFGDCATNDANLDAFGDFYFEFLVVDDFGHLADDAAAGDDLVATTYVLQ